MKDPLEEQVRAKVAEQQAEDAAARMAMGNPLPGPLKKAMALHQSIGVEKWKVRPLCDGDFEVLVEIEHPLRKVMEMQFEMAYRGTKGDSTVGFDSYTPRGPSMWQLAWMMTGPALRVRDTVRRGGVESLKKAAEDEFWEAPAPVLVSIYLAVAQQISVYWSTAQGYGPDKQAGGEASDAPENPTKWSGPASTDSAGALRSVAA